MKTPLCTYSRFRSRCGSPALANRPFCHFHTRLTKRATALLASRKARPLLQPEVFFGPLLDLQDVQSGIHRLLQGITSGTINPNDAEVLLDYIQEAGRRLDPAARPADNRPRP